MSAKKTILRVEDLLGHTHGLANNGEFPRETLRRNCEEMAAELNRLRRLLGLRPGKIWFTPKVGKRPS